MESDEPSLAGIEVYACRNDGSTYDTDRYRHLLARHQCNETQQGQ